MHVESAGGLVDVFVQRSLTAAEVHAQERPDTERFKTCLELHGILRKCSYLARDGRRVLCHFRSPDAESLRMALRVAGVDYDAVWTADVNDIPGAGDYVLVVERVFQHPLSPDQQRACRARTARLLQDLGVEPARVLLSRCGKRLLWLCRVHAPDAVTAVESDLASQGYDVWRCETLSTFESPDITNR
jgi:hypothetical protein